MKAKSLQSAIIMILASAMSIMLLISFSSCAKKITFENSSVVPAARGDVKVKKDKNKNYIIQIHLLNLAESKRLQPPKETYIVWMVSSDEITQNIGQINTSTSLFSRKLKTSFKTVTPLKPTKIFITAEDDKSIQYPRGEIVLSTENFWR